MQVILRPITTSETESVIAMLRDAEEGEERVRAAVLNEANISYGAFDGEIPVGAATVHWEQYESEIIYIAVTPDLRGSGYGKAMIEAVYPERVTGWFSDQRIEMDFSKDARYSSSSPGCCRGFIASGVLPVGGCTQDFTRR